ncbi:annexin-like protein RJ4 [Musa acuminata AAA Group]|uniref:annexin-like protein RJ4 n=1 Tax=Musa acuminata AAA Group TaxID=214697 RepID=UPI0031E352DB
MATLAVPETIPSASEDAEQIWKACKGWGTDETALITILAHRDATQRKIIRLAFEEQYKENLIMRLESELSGDLERAVYLWIFDPVEREAIIANIAVKKNIDYQAIIEIACVNSPKELLAVKEEYHARYKRSLEEDIAVHTVGDFRELLVSLVSTYRYDGDETDTGVVRLEAKTLHDAIKSQTFNHSEVIRILSTRSKAQLCATFNYYEDEYGIPITKALTSESPNEFALALRMAIRCIVSPQKYFAKVLENAVGKAGTDEDALTRVIVMHAEKDLKVIKEIFHKRTNATLKHAVGTETCGHYNSFLLALVGN